MKSMISLRWINAPRNEEAECADADEFEGKEEEEDEDEEAEEKDEAEEEAGRQGRHGAPRLRPSTRPPPQRGVPYPTRGGVGGRYSNWR